jgi:hypothetical protein
MHLIIILNIQLNAMIYFVRNTLFLNVPALGASDVDAAYKDFSIRLL